jgi:hypothetical protein
VKALGLLGVDLSDYAAVRVALDAFEAPRKLHTARQVQQDICADEA